MTLSLSLLAVQSCNSDKNEKADEKTVWEDAHENNVQTYKAKFVVNGKKMKAEFDSNGGLVKEEEDNQADNTDINTPDPMSG